MTLQGYRTCGDRVGVPAVDGHTGISKSRVLLRVVHRALHVCRGNCTRLLKQVCCLRHAVIS
eukprot:scaffold3277_cov218-Pinguiococcus_pyrenoidosus.AAC.5